MSACKQLIRMWCEANKIPWNVGEWRTVSKKSWERYESSSGSYYGEHTVRVVNHVPSGRFIRVETTDVYGDECYTTMDVPDEVFPKIVAKTVYLTKEQMARDCLSHGSEK